MKRKRKNTRDPKKNSECDPNDCYLSSLLSDLHTEGGRSLYTLSNHYKWFYKYEYYYYYTMHNTMHKIWILTSVTVTKEHNTQNRYIFTTRSIMPEWVFSLSTDPWLELLTISTHTDMPCRSHSRGSTWPVRAGVLTPPLMAYMTLLTVCICSVKLASDHFDPPFHTSLRYVWVCVER